MNLKSYIRGVPDFPIDGILFYDIATLLRSPEALEYCLDALETQLRAWNPDVIAGIESRGFLFAVPLAQRMGLPMMMIRKEGKLPGPTRSFVYELEYGTDTIEIQEDALESGQKVVILDDLLATGGTLAASVELCRQVGAEVVGCGVVIELTFLNGRAQFDVPIHALVEYDE
ncbi:MAG: adenine phosphoribosyltransferase [archaeon]|nr:adenine phosphoribosyltransferase [archaeon]MDA1168450.1 adenine phosphoribosyltransferase [archaeon]